MKSFFTILCLFCLLGAANHFAAYQTETPPGQPIFKWHKDLIPVYLHRGGSKYFSHVTLKKALEHSLSKWNSVKCGIPKLEFQRFVDEPDAKSNGKNTVIFRSEDWPPDVSGALAITTITVVSSTGEIFSADIEFNTVEYVFSIAATGTAFLHDFENTLTHELGHVLGIDHPEDKNEGEQKFATMYSTAPLGELQKRSLDTDDILGICAVYLLDEGGEAKSGEPENSDGCNVRPFR